MRYSRNFILLALLAAFLLACPAAANVRPIGQLPADPSLMKLPDGSGYTYAGAVNVLTTSPLDAYGAGDVFRTFRVDLAGIDATTVYSLPAGSGGGLPTGGSMLASSSQTAWLYRRFVDGTLDDFVGSYSDSAAGNAALQQAIWYAEDVWVDGRGQAAPIRGTALALWEAALANSSRNDAAGIVALAQTYALPSNLIMADAGTGSQESWVLVLEDRAAYTVPAPGAALLGVLGLGLTGWFRRYKAERSR